MEKKPGANFFNVPDSYVGWSYDEDSQMEYWDGQGSAPSVCQSPTDRAERHQANVDKIHSYVYGDKK